MARVPLAIVAATFFGICTATAAGGGAPADLAEQARVLLDAQAPQLKARVTGPETLELASAATSAVSLDNVRIQSAPEFHEFAEPPIHV